jgi:hypothetical protein
VCVCVCVFVCVPPAQDGGAGQPQAKPTERATVMVLESDGHGVITVITV